MPNFPVRMARIPLPYLYQFHLFSTLIQMFGYGIIKWRVFHIIGAVVNSESYIKEIVADITRLNLSIVLCQYKR
jgi:hypothetical protein